MYYSAPSLPPRIGCEWRVPERIDLRWYLNCTEADRSGVAYIVTLGDCENKLLKCFGLTKRQEIDCFCPFARQQKGLIKNVGSPVNFRQMRVR